MSISLIACIDKNSAIGHQGSLLTKPPLDFQYFKNLTIGNYCVFGRTTFEEIGTPLKNRKNIILTSKGKEGLPSGVFTYSSTDKILAEYKNYAEEDVKLYICGGEKVYEAFLPYANTINLTIVDHSFTQSDRYFPKFSLDEWEVVSNEKNCADETYPYDYYFVTYTRKLNIK